MVCLGDEEMEIDRQLIWLCVFYVIGKIKILDGVEKEIILLFPLCVI